MADPTVGPFLYNHPRDRVTGTPSVATGTETVGYEATYLTDWSDQYVQRPAMIDETSGAWAITFDDGGSPGGSPLLDQRIDLVVLQHNFDAGLSGVSFKGGGSLVSPTLEAPFTIPTKRDDGFAKKLWIDLRAESGYTELGFSTWWLEITGTNSVPLGAKLWLGSIVRELEEHFTFDNLYLENDTATSIVLATDAGPVWGYDLLINPRMFQGVQHGNSLTDLHALRAWYRACGGRAKLSLMIPDGNNPEDAWVVRWLNGAARDSTGLVRPIFDPQTFAFEGISSIQVSFDEITAGTPEWT